MRLEGACNIIVALHMPDIAAERKEMQDPEEPSLNPKHWRFDGFFYSNPDNPPVFVPNPPHMGTRTTPNLGTPTGRLFFIAMALLVMGAVVLTFML